MCTAVTYCNKGHYFGRNLDVDFPRREHITITPRNFPLSFRAERSISVHHAIIGMAYTDRGYPLYYDAVNEMGLAMAGLHFPHSARYHPHAEGKHNIAPFELIPWVLAQCDNLLQARRLLEQLNVLALPFSTELPLTPLHWMLADRNGGALVVESTKNGLNLWDNPAGVMTNEPPFPEQMLRLADFMALSPDPPENRLAPDLDLPEYSRGMGASGLPGDFSSPSRFVRAVFAKCNACSGTLETENVHQLFHILSSVAMPRGCVRLANGRTEITACSTCCSMDRGIYYYTTYENRQIIGVDLFRAALDGSELILYPLLIPKTILLQNETRL